MRKVRKSFSDSEVLKISELFKENGYTVDYSPVASFYLEKIKPKYCKIIPIEFGHWGFKIFMRPINNNQLEYDESVDMLNEINNDVYLLKAVMDIWDNCEDFIVL